MVVGQRTRRVGMPACPRNACVRHPDADRFSCWRPRSVRDTPEQHGSERGAALGPSPGRCRFRVRLSHKPPIDPVRRSVMGRPMPGRLSMVRKWEATLVRAINRDESPTSLVPSFLDPFVQQPRVQARATSFSYDVAATARSGRCRGWHARPERSSTTAARISGGSAGSAYADSAPSWTSRSATKNVRSRPGYLHSLAYSPPYACAALTTASAARQNSLAFAWSRQTKTTRGGAVQCFA
jgi:hypothetical protein